MIRAILIVLVATVLGWGIGHASRPLTSAKAPDVSDLLRVSVRDGDFRTIQERTQSDVVLYTLSDCAVSRQAKAFLDARGIDYAELDVGESLDARLEAKSLGATKVPFMLMGQRSIEGFDETQFVAVLNEQRGNWSSDDLSSRRPQ